MLEAVGEPKVGHDHVPVSVEEQILEFEVTMDDLFLMKVPDGRDKLSEQLAGIAFFEVAVGEDVIEEFAAGGIFEDDSDVLVSFDDIVEMNDIRVIQCLHRLMIRKHSEMKEIGHTRRTSISRSILLMRTVESTLPLRISFTATSSPH